MNLKMHYVDTMLARLRGLPVPTDPAADAEPAAAPNTVTIHLGRDGRPVPPELLAVVGLMAEAISEAAAALPTAEPVPEGYARNSKQHLVPLAQVREQDKLRDGVTLAIALEGVLLNRLLAGFKSRALANMAQLVVTAAAEYNEILGGEEGNLTCRTYDGAWKVQRVCRDVIGFTERVQAAKALVQRCFSNWVSTIRAQGGEGVEAAIGCIEVLIHRAFTTDRNGDLRIGPVMELRQVRIDDATWDDAMQALSESTDVTGSAVYVRIAQRSATGAYVPVPIDLAVV